MEKIEITHSVLGSPCDKIRNTGSKHLTNLDDGLLVPFEKRTEVE